MNVWAVSSFVVTFTLDAEGGMFGAAASAAVAELVSVSKLAAVERCSSHVTSIVAPWSASTSVSLLAVGMEMFVSAPSVATRIDCYV